MAHIPLLSAPPRLTAEGSLTLRVRLGGCLCHWPLSHIKCAELSAEAVEIPPEVTASGPERGLDKPGMRPSLQCRQRDADRPGCGPGRHIRLGHPPRMQHPVQTLQTPNQSPGGIAAFAAFSYIENVEFVEFLAPQNVSGPGGSSARAARVETA